MLGVLRRKVASASGLGKSMYAVRPAVSTSRISSAATEEILLLPRQCGHARHFSHLVLPGCSVNLRPERRPDLVFGGCLCVFLYIIEKSRAEAVIVMIVVIGSGGGGCDGEGLTVVVVVADSGGIGDSNGDNDGGGEMADDGSGGGGCNDKYMVRSDGWGAVGNLHSSLSQQICIRPFCSNSGDLVDAVVPYMGESISDGTLAKLLKNPGDRVEVDEPIAQIETDKVTIDVTSPEAGVIQKVEYRFNTGTLHFLPQFVAKEGDTVEPGFKVAIISKSGEGVESVDHVAPSEKPSEKEALKPTSPIQEKKEEEMKPKVETVPVKEKSKGTSPPPKRSATEPQLPPKERERRVPMTRLRKRVATRLKDSQNTFALLTTFNEVDMTNLMKLRSEYKDTFVEKHGVKLGLMSGFVKAAVSALQNQPIVNAVIDGDDIIYRDYVDISIAVGTPKA
ncbi:hypothetical protein MTR67_052991 [Solanum verrucosum]|uniref:Dihydrolipoamide acetyltransferase component of pyruvate dehydrogenase complex n=1 Tax=Solanum verrucosum TaxID=315347 RepID=A0AAF0VA60_SOLVR|nr:hypothetical protein MTR67_052991 [Solanum verrucosum]